MKIFFNKKQKEYKNIIAILYLFSSQLFFSVTTIFGYQYKGIESSNIYVVYIMGIMIISLLLSIKTFIKNRFHFNFKEVFVLWLPLFFLVEMLIRSLIYNEISLSFHYFVYFCLWSVPALYGAVYIKKTCSFNELIKWFEIVEWIFTIAVIFTFLLPYLSGSSYNMYFRETNINYQSAAYMSSFAYGLNLYFLFYGKAVKRFKLMNTKIYFGISLLVLLVQLVCVFIAGGRGGAVLAVLYTVFFLINTLIDKKVNRKLKGIILAIAIVVIIVCILPLLMKNSNFYASFFRSFAFINKDGINWEGSSGRDIVYHIAFERSMKKPIIGYGIFYSLGMFFYPHNFFLELFQGGGIIYLVVGSFFLFYILVKSFIISKKEDNPIQIILFLYPVVMLMFSGTYTQNALFWFVACYTLISQNELKQKSCC